VKLELTMVPPPTVAPAHDDAVKLGLVRGLLAERADSMCHCNNCGSWIRAGEWEVWVPDGIQQRDPAWAVEEQCRINAYNGSFSMWCLKCAPKKSRPAASSNPRSKRGFFASLFGKSERTGA
jgi:hypothetical protein